MFPPLIFFLAWLFHGVATSAAHCRRHIAAYPGPRQQSLRLFFNANNAVHWIWVVVGPAVLPLIYVLTERATRPSRYR